MERTTMIRDLARERFDLLVIGGGITGAGIAREAALRGLKVALVEAVDFAAGTSSRSTKLIHGGLRYLKNLEFRLVRESVAERQRLLTMAPHLARATQFLFPVWQGDADGLFKLHIGLSLYDWFAGKSNPIPHKMHGKAAVLSLEPGLRAQGLKGGAVYCDARTDDGRLTLEVLQSAVAHGAVAANYVGVTGFVKDDAGRITGAMVEDRISGESFPVQADRVLAAAGPWADAIRQLDDPGAPRLLRLSKGVHITVPASRLPLTHAVVMRGPDARMMFAVPTGDCTYLGTTDTDYDGAPGAERVEAADVDYILASAALSFPAAGLTRDDIISTWAGTRPLVAPAGGKKVGATSRDYTVVHSPSGLVTVAGGKLTAFRAMAEHIVDGLCPATQSPDHLVKSTAPLPGATQPVYTELELVQLAQQTGLRPERLSQLQERYGARLRQIAADVRPDEAGAEMAWIKACVRHAVQQEMAVRLVDVLRRRLDLLLWTPGNGRAELPLLSAEMAGLLGWSPERSAAEIDRTQAEIDAMFAWKAEPADKEGGHPA